MAKLEVFNNTVELISAGEAMATEALTNLAFFRHTPSYLALKRRLHFGPDVCGTLLSFSQSTISVACCSLSWNNGGQLCSVQPKPCGTHHLQRHGRVQTSVEHGIINRVIRWIIPPAKTIGMRMYRDRIRSVLAGEARITSQTSDIHFGYTEVN